MEQVLYWLGMALLWIWGALFLHAILKMLFAPSAEAPAYEAEGQSDLPGPHPWQRRVPVGIAPHSVHYAITPWCCQLLCEREAVYTLYADGADPYDYLDSCAEHLGELVSDAQVHSLYRIPGPYRDRETYRPYDAEEHTAPEFGRMQEVAEAQAVPAAAAEEPLVPGHEVGCNCADCGHAWMEANLEPTSAPDFPAALEKRTLGWEEVEPPRPNDRRYRAERAGVRYEIDARGGLARLRRNGRFLTGWTELIAVAEIADLAARVGAPTVDGLEQDPWAEAFEVSPCS